MGCVRAGVWWWVPRCRCLWDEECGMFRISPHLLTTNDRVHFPQAGTLREVNGVLLQRLACSVS